MAGLEWLLLILGTIAASVALVAAALIVGKFSFIVAGVAAHIGRTLRGFGSDIVRFVGGLIVALAMVAVALGRITILRPQSARNAAISSGRECGAAFRSLGRALFIRPLELIGLAGVAGHVAERMPIALGSGSDPRAQTDFAGYTILRELARGGSGARLFVAEPDVSTRRKLKLPDGFVVIKSFDFDDGTHAAEMLREGRALDAARKLGLVLDHEASERRFHYVMRYYEGVDLGRFVRGLHEAAGADALDRERLVLVGSLVRDIVATLRDWHAAGLWHKDIKPENAIVHEGRATLVDLGLVTPLASHMTLTTHGTEYFRDPELVRQALRGARVSEIDAARFDLYGAGAVLYFVLEGTFPAHGVLSSFQKQSPASLQWIARRAMADFDRRYPDAESMLADLDRALLGEDPAAVRPADLPSMQANRAHVDGASAASEEARFLDETLRGGESSAGSPRTPQPSTAPPDAVGLIRPRLRVHNWWTGAYSVVSLRPLPPSYAQLDGRRIGVAMGILVASLAALGAVIAAWTVLTSEGAYVGFESSPIFDWRIGPSDMQETSTSTSISTPSPSQPSSTQPTPASPAPEPAAADSLAPDTQRQAD